MGGVDIQGNIGLYAMIAVGVVVLLLGIILFKKLGIDRVRNKKEARTTAMMDRMSMRRPSVNTAYLEKEFNQSIQSLVGALYYQNPQGLPTQNVSPELYMEWYGKLKREYELGIQKSVYDFKMVKSHVCKQDNSNMYGVSHIEMETEFTIDFLYNHVTQKKRSIRNFKQVFVFLNVNNGWVLDKALPEFDVKEEVLAV